MGALLHLTSLAAPTNANPRPSFWGAFGIGCLTGIVLQITTIRFFFFGQVPVLLFNWYTILAYPVALVAGFLYMSRVKSKYRFLGYLLPVLFSWMLALLFAYVFLPAWIQAAVDGA